MKNKLKLSVVMPVFNEEKNIKLIAEKFKKLKYKNFEVILVEDGGSKDNTRSELLKVSKKNKFIKYLFTTQRGYGISIFNGLKKANGEYLCWTHADLQTDPADTIKALELIKTQAEPEKSYIKGNRYGRPIFDIFFTFGMSIFETIVLKKRLYDINAQPNLFHNSLLSLMTKPPEDFSFDLYTYYIAKINKFNIVRFPVYFGERLHGESSWKTGLGSKIMFIKRTIKFTLSLKKLLKEQ